jgi:hypothetical protein
MNQHIRITNLSELRYYATEKALSEKSDDFLYRFHKFLISAGWRRVDDRRRSAMFIKTYERNDRRITLQGWHGCGTGVRNFGNLKLAFDLYDNQLDGRGPLMRNTEQRYSIPLSTGTVGDAEAFIHAVEKYIHSTCGL